LDIGYSLLDIGYSLLDIGYSLLDIGYSLLAVGYSKWGRTAQQSQLINEALISHTTGAAFLTEPTEKKGLKD
jgi:hypothetical protein